MLGSGSVFLNYLMIYLSGEKIMYVDEEGIVMVNF